MYSEPHRNAALTLFNGLKQCGWRLATAESCTGGMLSALLTSIPGSSGVFDRGYVVYSNRAKTDLLGIDAKLIATHGAVSPETAHAMALHAQNKGGTDAALAITGIAGPGGGSDEKPVGLVYIGMATPGHVEVKRCLFDGNRDEVRLAAMEEAMFMLIKATKRETERSRRDSEIRR